MKFNFFYLITFILEIAVYKFLTLNALNHFLKWSKSNLIYESTMIYTPSLKKKKTLCQDNKIFRSRNVLIFLKKAILHWGQGIYSSDCLFGRCVLLQEDYFVTFSVFKDFSVCMSTVFL